MIQAYGIQLSSFGKITRMLNVGCRIFVSLAILASLLLYPFDAHANDRMTFIRDAEIEYYLRALGKPIFRAADLDPEAVNVAIILDSDINAFVAGGQNIFFYTGLLMATDTPEQLQGVIAHETGHIAGGHLIRGSEAMRNASTQAIIGMLAGLAIGAASGRGDVAIGAIGAGANIAERTFFSFSRAQEASADAAAMRFLDKTGESSVGLKEFMKKLAQQELLPQDRQAEYVRTHPFSRDRVDAIEQHVATSKIADSHLPPDSTLNHERMKAKLLGYLQPDAALLRYTDKDPRQTARYARAIALERRGQMERALILAQGLVKEEPNNPFFCELVAQLLFEQGKIRDSIQSYERAVELLPDSSLLRVALAHALLESREMVAIDPAIQHLLEANRLESRDPQTWRFLAAAWSKKAESSRTPHDQALVSYALAEEALAEGHEKKARQYADRALKSLKKGSPYWLRAQDIKLSVDETAKD